MQCIGALDDISPLRQVMIRCPAGELQILSVQPPRRYLWHAVPDEQVARAQHSGLADTLSHLGVSLVEITGDKKSPNLCFCRDQLITLPDGVMLTRLLSPCRKNEVNAAVQALSAAGVNVLPATEHGGPYEGGDFILMEDGIMLAGCSGRTTIQAINHLRPLLLRSGIKSVIPICVPDGFLHLDCAVLPIGKRRIICVMNFEPDVLGEFQRSGYRIIRIPAEWAGQSNLGLNMLFVHPTLALVSNGADSRLLELLHENGIQTRRLPVSEFEKGGGGIHCLVATISRERTV